MIKMKTTPLDTLLDNFYGKPGTEERDNFEKEVTDSVTAWKMREALKKARQEATLTQEELGERIGVKKAQISRIENGKGTLNLNTIKRVAKALGVEPYLDLGHMGRFAL